MAASRTPPALLFVITGSQGAGKTTFCDQLIQAAREAGWQTAGVLSRPMFAENLRSGILVEDLRRGETRQLAMRSEIPTPGSKHWKFDREALDWGNQILARSTPVDLLVVDELGPLEFEREDGWQAGLEAIDSHQYAIALVVVRAEMLGEVMVRWPEANLVEIDTPEESTRKAHILSEQLF